MTVPGRRWLAVVLLACTGCARSGGSVELMAPFSDDTVVGTITAAWSDGGEERTGAGPGVTERKLMFHLDARNRLADRLFVRLRDFRLISRDGTVAPSAVAAACTLPPGVTPGVLAGSVWVPVAQAAAIRGFRVDHFAVPLSERGRAFYREFLLRQRPDAAAAIDAELAAYAAAPPCSPTL